MPPTDLQDRSTPEVSDQKSCERWLQKTPLSDARQACFELTSLLEDLEDSPPATRHYLAVLETLRKPVYVAQHENSKRFAGRPVPLLEQEASSFHQVYDLLTTYGRSYKRLAVEVSGDLTHEMSPRLALLIARGLEALCELMYAHYRARREVEGELWQELHQLFAMAESANVEHDTSDDEGMLSPAPFEHYMREILLQLASPYALTSRELEWTRRWTRNWSQKPVFTYPSDGSEVLAVDLDGDSPARRVRGGQGESWRYIDLAQLKKSVRRRIHGLAAGRTTAELGLGSDCNSTEAAELLQRLHQQWFEVVARQFKRRSVTGRLELASTFSDIHLAIGGRIARTQQRPWDYSRRDNEQLFVYGTTGSSGGTEESFVVERWEMLDDSASGFRVRRKGPGDRIAHLQLVGLRPPGAPSFILCEVRWLSEGLDGTITCGVQALPGLAQPISARPAPTPDQPEEAYGHAFVLPATPGSDPSLVLPLGSYREGRLFELRHEDNIRRVRLTALTKQGFDYERVSFAVGA